MSGGKLLSGAGFVAEQPFDEDLESLRVAPGVGGARVGAVRAHRPAVAAVTVFVVVGALERWWVASHPLGTLTSDGSVIGLMALHLLHHGQLSAYMWGQAYGGSLEAALTAVVFAFLGVGRDQLLATTALSSALAAAALWRTGRRIVGDRAAIIGALAFWVWPASFVWRSLKPGGTYMIGLAIALCAVGQLARIRSGEGSRGRVAWAGGLCGVALWSSPMSLQLLIPAMIWCAPALVRLRRRIGALLAGMLVGALPALAFGATHGGANLRLPGGAGGALAGTADRFLQFFRIQAPMALGLRVERTFTWIGGPLGPAVASVAAAGFVAVVVLVVVIGRAPQCRLPVLTLLLLPILFSFNTMANHIGQARYVMFGSSMAALLVAVGLEKAGDVVSRSRVMRWVARARRIPEPVRTVAGTRSVPVLGWAGLSLLAGLGVVALGKMPGDQLVRFPAPDVPAPLDDTSLQSLLARHGVRDAYADYWIAYRITFETRGSVDVAPYANDRYPSLTRTVGTSVSAAYIFVSASATLGRFETWCRHHAVSMQVWRDVAFTVVRPTPKVLPTQLPPSALQ